METEAFKEESGPGVSLGDLAPKRQWRSPKRSAIYLSQQVQKKWVISPTPYQLFTLLLVWRVARRIRQRSRQRLRKQVEHCNKFISKHRFRWHRANRTVRTRPQLVTFREFRCRWRTRSPRNKRPRRQPHFRTSTSTCSTPSSTMQRTIAPVTLDLPPAVVRLRHRRIGTPTTRMHHHQAATINPTEDHLPKWTITVISTGTSTAGTMVADPVTTDHTVMNVIDHDMVGKTRLLVTSDGRVHPSATSTAAIATNHTDVLTRTATKMADTGDDFFRAD